MHGIDPKRWFYRGLRAHLRGEPANRIVLSGAACEQWLNGLLFRVIAEDLPGHLTAYPEWNGRQHDVAVLPVAQRDGYAIVDWAHPECVVENKLVYPSFPAGKRDRQIARLAEQLRADSSAVHRIGFLLAIWVDRAAGNETFGQFRRDVGMRLRAAVQRIPARWNATIDHGGVMETVLPEMSIRVGGAPVVVACAAQYFRLYA